MAGAALQRMEADEVLVWCQGKERRYELVEGRPVEMMPDAGLADAGKLGANNVHDMVVVNVSVVLGNQLRGCCLTTADFASINRVGPMRRPDVVVTCDPPRGDVFDAKEPRMVVEVLSPSNKGVAWERKMREYRQHERLDSILLIVSEIVAATLYTREGTGWDAADFERRADPIELSRIDCRLSMSEIYDGTDLEEDPELQA